MKKVDLIKFRCTPEFKARVAREATYRGVSLSEFVEGAIENELRPANSAAGSYVAPFRPGGDRALVDGEQAKVVGAPSTPGLEPVPPVRMNCPANGKPCSCSGVCTREVVMSEPVVLGVSTCPHDRPRAACWECA